jgi:HK97 family phage major capsid protein
MPLSTIKALKDQVKTLETRVGELGERKEKVAVGSTAVSKELATRASSLYLLSRIRDTQPEAITGFQDVKEYATRAMVPTDTTDWLAEEFSKDIYERMTLLADVESLFPKYTISQNVESLSIPQKTSKTKAFLIQPAADAIQSAITAAKVTFRAKRLVVLAVLADQADDETVVALIDVIKQDIAEALVNGMENAIINGDVTAGDTNINGADVGAAANDQLRTFNGLRKITMNSTNTVDFGGELTYANIAGMRKLMGKEGVKQSDLVYVVSPATYHNMILIPELITVDKYGAKATVVTGEVAKIGAVPIIVSEYVPENLDATGVVTDDGDKTAILLVNRKYFAVASRGRAGFERDRNIVSATNLFVGHRDVDFNALLSNKEISVLGYNVPA